MPANYKPFDKEEWLRLEKRRMNSGVLPSRPLSGAAQDT